MSGNSPFTNTIGAPVQGRECRTVSEETSHTFKRLKREPVYLKVYKAMEADIISGILPEGAFLPTEADLCEQFGVTRSSIREGMRLLEQSGLVERGYGKRFVVRRPRSSDIAASTSRSLALGGVTFREVWEALATAYPQAARMAVKRLTKEGMTALRTIHGELEAAEANDHDRIVNVTVEFFQCIASALDNRVLLAMLQSLNLMIGASLRHVISETPNAKRRILKAQREIITALERGNEAETAHWVAKHIDDLKRGYKVARVDMDEPIF